MPTPLPPASDYTGGSTTQGGKKTFMTAVIDYLTAAFGTDGTPSAVRAALGVLAKAGDTLTGLLKFAKGADIASATTVNLSTATGNTVKITGTTGIGAWTMTSGQVMDVVFAAALTLTHHATNNNLPGAANITTAAGDRARLYYDGTTVYLLDYTRANGTPVTTVTTTNDASFASNTVNPASTGWVRGAMSAIATSAGFAISLAASGYIKLPSWLGGLVIQWVFDSSAIAAGGVVTTTFPIAFPTACRWATVVGYDTNSGNINYAMNTQSFTTTGVSIGNPGANLGGAGRYVLAFGN